MQEVTVCGRNKNCSHCKPEELNPKLQENLKISENIQHCPHNQNWRQKLLKFRALDSDDRQSEALSVTKKKE